MVRRAKSILRTNEFTVLYDKGYHTGSELKTAQDLGVETIVAIPSLPSTSQAPNHDYNSENFIYDKEADTYTCPEGITLRTNGTWHKEQTVLLTLSFSSSTEQVPVKHVRLIHSVPDPKTAG